MPAAAPAPDSPPASRARLPRTAWALGWVSLFMDMSSELVHAVLPVYMSSVLGLSLLTIGLVEGVAEATASLLKLVSGAWSDRLGRRKSLAVLGYGLSALTKPLFPLASGATELIAARLVDRVGKGIRGAPRDALLADATAPELRNAAYGLRQSMDTVGAFLGPLAAIVLLGWMPGRLRGVLWFGVLPALLAVGVLVLAVREPPPRRDSGAAGGARPAGRRRPRLSEARRLPRAYWMVVLTAGMFTLARLSEAFLVLRGRQIGLSLHWVPLVTLGFSLVYALSAYPAGLLAQRRGRGPLLAAGMAVLLASMLALAAGGMPGLWLGVALYGLHLGLTQGVFAAAVAATAPAELRGSAFGAFHLVTGVLQLLAGLGAGWLWQDFGATAAFGAGALLAAAALGMTLLARAWTGQPRA